ncbi:hypothetical protein Bpfe_019125 [Biomphalaria pfeifferi]|uniref:Uncharacterized protein n=1 Tax=Biomphalaria pfeifferi TaxID=112525 RepID=A0AAD8F5Y8_BIOPF|nr:hypothetical protein Bpfe_019125 [Biomphalaria pfeifferi]
MTSSKAGRASSLSSGPWSVFFTDLVDLSDTTRISQDHRNEKGFHYETSDHSDGSLWRPLLMVTVINCKGHPSVLASLLQLTAAGNCLLLTFRRTSSERRT